MLPWWLYVLLAGAAYVLLKHVAPEQAAAAGHAALGDLCALLAPIITIGCLLLAAARLYDGDGQDQVPPTGPDHGCDDEGNEDEDEDDDADPGHPGRP